MAGKCENTTEHSLSTMNTFREDYNGRDRPWRPSDEIKEEWRRRRSDNTSLRNSQEEKRGKNIGRMDRPQHLVCVDDSKEAKRAVKFALKNVPSNHKLVLLNGSYQPHVGGYYEPTELSEERRQSIMKICKKKGFDCSFKTFDYTSNRDFGDSVCTLASRIGAQSVIIGKREDVSDTRRNILGSASQSVLSSCGVPVTVVQSKAHASF